MSVSQYLKQGRDYKFSGPFDKLGKLPAGVYKLKRDAWGNLFVRESSLNTDNIIEMEGSPAQDINNKVRDFLNPDVKAAFDRYDIVYKRGILLYGPPGTGKTSIVHLVIKTAVESDMIVFLNASPYNIAEAVTSIRDIEGENRPVLVVWEEFEDMLFEDETEVLDMLDGVDQTPNTFYIATTNYIDRIPSRIKNRPSRFAEVIEIGTPGPALRKEYLKAKIHAEDKIDIDEWVEKTEGFVLDHLKDLIISVLVLNVPLDRAIDKIKALQREDQESSDSTNVNSGKELLAELVNSLNKRPTLEAADCPEPILSKEC